ncbi:MAG: hypothetical protein R3C71_03490 [Candidatus Krumholzibacteriia bacterium]
MAENHDDQVRRNYEAFKERLPALLRDHPGQVALMHDGELVEVFDTVGDAYLAGLKIYGKGEFSVQEISGDVIDLGYYSYAMP